MFEWHNITNALMQQMQQIEPTVNSIHNVSVLELINRSTLFCFP